jgi:hypothetical protein
MIEMKNCVLCLIEMVVQMEEMGEGLVERGDE